MTNNKTMVAEFAKFIKKEGNWDLFLTITFRKRTPVIQAKKSFKYFFKQLNTKEKSFFRKFVKCWVFF